MSNFLDYTKAAYTSIKYGRLWFFIWIVFGGDFSPTPDQSLILIFRPNLAD